MHGYMDVHREIPDYRILCIILDGGYSSMIINGRMNPNLISKYKPVASRDWSTQTLNCMNNYMVNVEFSLPVLYVTKILTLKCHVNDSAEGIYDMIVRMSYLLDKPL